MGENAALVEAVEKCQLGMALAVGHANRPTAQLLGEFELVWIAGQDFSARSERSQHRFDLPTTMLIVVGKVKKDEFFRVLWRPVWGWRR
jgi:hypothetical protein